MSTETYKRTYHRIDKRIDAIDYQLNEVITNRYQAEIENNNKKNFYYQSIVDYMLHERAEMHNTEYPILTESGFNKMTDIDGVYSEEMHIPSYNLYYNENYKSKEITFLELKQTKSSKTFLNWIDALEGDITKRITSGDFRTAAMTNGLRKEILTLVKLSNDSKVVVAITWDKTGMNGGFETHFFEYNRETRLMEFLSKQSRMMDFKNTLTDLTK